MIIMEEQQKLQLLNETLSSDQLTWKDIATIKLLFQNNPGLESTISLSQPTAYARLEQLMIRFANRQQAIQSVHDVPVLASGAEATGIGIGFLPAIPPLLAGAVKVISLLGTGAWLLWQYITYKDEALQDRAESSDLMNILLTEAEQNGFSREETVRFLNNFFNKKNDNGVFSGFINGLKTIIPLAVGVAGLYFFRKPIANALQNGYGKVRKQLKSGK